MAVFANVDNQHWFFTCNRCKPRLSSKKFSSMKKAEQEEQKHLREKH